MSPILCVWLPKLYIWLENPLKLTSLPLYMSSHTLCWRHYTCSVRHHRWPMYAIICVIQDIISTRYDTLYYLWHHMHYIHSITRIIYDISSTLYDVTFTMCVTSHNDPINGNNHYMFMIYSLDMASGTVIWPNNHFVPSEPLCLSLHSMYFWHFTQCTNFLKSSECMSSQPVYVWDRMHYIWHHIHSSWLQKIVVITLHPLHSWHHTPNIWHNTYGSTNIIFVICPNISNTISNESVSSNPVYQLYHTLSLYDITHCTRDIIYSMHAITTTV